MNFENVSSMRPFISLLVTTLVIQFVLVSVSFPLTELFSATGMFYIDAPFHWYQMKLAVNLSWTGNLVGFDPFFAAGYLGGLTYNISAKLPAVIAVFGRSWLDEMTVYKLVSFALAVLAPVLIPLSLRLLRLQWGEIAAGSILGILLWWTSVFRWYYTAGMVAFVFGTYLAVLYFALMIACWKQLRSLGSLTGLCVLGFVGLLLHPFFPVVVIVASPIYWAINRKTLRMSETGIVLAVVPFAIFCLSLFWLLPLYYNVDELTSGISTAPYQRIVDIKLVWMEFMGIWSGDYHGSKLYGPLAVASLWGCYMAPPEKRKLGATFALAGMVLVLFAAVGAAVPILGMLQPNRFAPVGYLMFVVPAAVGFALLVESALNRKKNRIWLASVVVLGVTFPPVLYAANEMRKEISYADTGHFGARPPEVRGMGEYSKWLLTWLQRETTDSARILFETSKARIHDGGHMAGYYAYVTQREFIGGPYPFMHFAGFWDGWLFGRPISTFGTEEFGNYLESYNIRWIVVQSLESKRYLDSVPGVVPGSQFKEFKTYEVRRRSTFFAAGAGEITARGHNNLALNKLSDGRVILKYHYIRGLSSDPKVTISPVKLMDDPQPFIMIENAPSKLRLFIP